MSGAPRLLEFWFRLLLVGLRGTEPLDVDNDIGNPIVFWLLLTFELVVVVDMVDDVFIGVDDCNGVDVVKLFCCWCSCSNWCWCVLLTLLFFNDCDIVALLWLLLTILFKLFAVDESRLFNVLLGMLERRFIEGFTFTFRPMSVWLGFISRVLEWERRKKPNK